MRNATQIFSQKKTRGEPVVMLTCYDYPTAVAEDAAGVDIIFVGDSVGTNVLGYESIQQVTMDDMLHHVRAVRRGVKRAFLMADMPYRSFETPAMAVENARKLVDAGVEAVKLEGGDHVTDVVKALRAEHIEVCGHVGFTPQTAGNRGRAVGKTIEEARTLLTDARALADAGVFMMVVELVPEALSQRIAREVPCCIIGIGSGRGLDGEVQVVNDILGITPRAFRHAKRYTDWRDQAETVFAKYVSDVRARRFPGAENAILLPQDVCQTLDDMDQANESKENNKNREKP